MRNLIKLVCIAICILGLRSVAFGATVSGTVKGPDGAPFEGAFIEAQNMQSKITVIVQSNKAGHYHFDNLRAGGYELRARAMGYKGEQHSGVSLADGQSSSFDFALQKGTVRWSDLSIYQGVTLFPDLTGKKEFAGRCMGCHGFESRMAAVHRDEDGWRDRVNYMRYTMRLGGWTDQEFENIGTYLNSLFGDESVLPASPADLPAYKNLEQHFSDEATKIVYVEYTLPGLGRMPWDVNPGKDGKLWIPYYSQVNMVGKLDPNTGEVKEFPLVAQPRVGMHSAWQGPDGTVWFTEQANNRLGKLDPTTGKIVEIQDDHVSGKVRPTSEVMYDSDASRNGVSKHTVRVDSHGIVWASGSPISRFDPETGKFTEFKEGAYSLALDDQGNGWFTSGDDLVRIDGGTLQETKYTPPTHDHNFNRRIIIDNAGIIWFAEYNTGKLTSFDPKAEKFREYQLPGPKPTPYAIGFDKNHDLWYSSLDTDVIGQLNTTTGKVIEYPYVHRENSMREFYYDGQGRMWYGSPANNKVGYFYVAEN
jgi:virginiamycin B lyase